MTWTTQISKSTGKTYWFNTKTGASVWEEPEELKNSVKGATVESRGSLIVNDSTSEDSKSNSLALETATYDSYPLSDPLAFHIANSDVISAGTDIRQYRERADELCRRLSEGENPTPRAIGFHRFPPIVENRLVTVIEGVADKYELHSRVIVPDKDTLAHVLVWRDGGEPPEIMAEQEEEKRLEAIAAELKRKELEQLAAARQKASRISVPKKKGSDSAAYASLVSFNLEEEGKRKRQETEDFVAWKKSKINDKTYAVDSSKELLTTKEEEYNEVDNL